jgi:predicted transcriptional regulator
MHEQALIRMIDRGLADANSGRVVSHDHMKRRIDRAEDAARSIAPRDGQQ